MRSHGVCRPEPGGSRRAQRPPGPCVSSQMAAFPPFPEADGGPVVRGRHACRTRCCASGHRGRVCTSAAVSGAVLSVRDQTAPSLRLRCLPGVYSEGELPDPAAISIFKFSRTLRSHGGSRQRCAGSLSPQPRHHLLFIFLNCHPNRREVTPHGGFPSP